MTKSELAAQKCVKLGREGGPWVARFLEHVSDLCERAIASGDTSGLEELVLREPVDADLLEAREICAVFSEARGAFSTAARYRAGEFDNVRDYELNLAILALRRGREIERGEGK